MKKHIGGEATDFANKSGFSLVEILVTLVIASSIIGIMATGIPNFRRTLKKYLDQSLLEEEYLIFLVVFERDYSQAEVTNTTALENLDDMVFRIDYNSDGDYLDSGERIQYRWNKKKKRIDRKSGKGYFQSFLEGIQNFTWQKVKKAPVCHRMTLQTIFSDNRKSLTFCRHGLSNI